MKAEKLNIDIPAPDPANGKSNASIGTAKIVAGEAFVEIETAQVTPDSRIFVTTTTKTDKVLSVTEKIDKDRFKVEISTPAAEDIEFNWWVVN